MDIYIMKYDAQKEQYTADRSLNLAAIPRVDDKIVYNDNKGVGHVYVVDEVIFAESRPIEIYVHSISTLTDYNCRRGLKT
jgi:hypothetical protein